MPLRAGISDIVVDTNVFLHANNPGVKYCLTAQTFLNELQNSAHLLCVDEIPDFDGPNNKSFIAQEYLEKISFATSAGIILYSIIKKNRVKPIGKNRITPHKRRVCRLIRDKTDRMFLCVTLESDSKLFISNDFEDFQAGKRTDIKSEFGVDVKTTSET